MLTENAEMMIWTLEDVGDLEPYYSLCKKKIDKNKYQLRHLQNLYIISSEKEESE